MTFATPEAADARAESGGAPIADKILNGAAGFWFLVAAIGQWLFVLFIVGFYAFPTFSGNFEAWDKNTFMTHGYVAGDTAGNLAFAIHVMLAAVITASGTVQLIPWIRARAISFHRWSGRTFILAAFVISLAGLFMNATRGAGTFEHVPIALNAVLLMFCAGQTIGHVWAGNIDVHRRWALRTFMLMNGVWFLRVGMMAWMFGKIGLLGGPKEFDASFYAFWTYGSYLVPLAVLDLYFWTQDRGGAGVKVAMAGLLVLLTTAMGAGIAGAAIAIWWRLLLKAW
ncbi:MAG: DUF2306 domain-containing protein [Alphaproteobacteria bacterium]|nr:DUF2306 domain-containing protein [Alphaproteobacteria bacterium]